MKTIRIISWDVIICIVPFVSALGFSDREENCDTTYPFFKSVMFVVFSLTGGFALYQYFKIVCISAGALFKLEK